MSAINERVSDLIEKFTSDDMAALMRFVECCEDPDAGGHDVEKNIITRLSQYGALRQVRPGYHEVTEFGEFILNGGIDELQQYRAAAELEVSDDELNAALTVHCLKTDGHSQLSDAFRAGYKYSRRAAPQVTSVPEAPDGYRVCLVPLEHTDAFRDACSVAFDEFNRGTGPCGVFIAGHRAMLSAAPAVPAEQLSGNAEQVSQPRIPSNQ